MNKQKRVIDLIEEDIPTYHTRYMRKQFYQRFSTVTNISPAVANEMYQWISGDTSASSNAVSKEVRQRLQLALDNQDPDIAFDLRHLNEGRPEKYNEFWGYVQEFIEEEQLNAVDDRRHGQVCHMALAMSIPDLIQKVKDKHPNVETPSASWVGLQFAPQHPLYHSSIHYTGRLAIKRMVQSRQLSHAHIDQHYCATLFKYLKEFAVQYRDHTLMINWDDKHSIQVGEPGYPVAAAERGKKVLVAEGLSFSVADHDFTKGKLIPSVTMKIAIPHNVTESFYTGLVDICLKEAAFEKSTPIRHAAELGKFLQSPNEEQVPLQPILAVLSDGGPDHRVSYLATQISLICLFLRYDLDYLVAIQGAPYQSYRNPVERIMSILNLALQSVGVMRAKMDEMAEFKLKSINSLADLRNAATKIPGLQEKYLQSMEPVKELLNGRFSRLALKGKSFSTTTSATADEIQELFDVIHSVDSGVTRSDTAKAVLNKRPGLKNFMEHCCQSHHYSFTIKKCGNSDCDICNPPRLSEEMFQTLNFFPGPVPLPQSDHYSDFVDVWGKTPTEEHRPTLKAHKAEQKPPFTLTKENCRSFITCSECLKPRLVHSRRALKPDQEQVFQRVIENTDFVCGQPLFPSEHELHDVVVSQVPCSADISVLYYSVKQTVGQRNVCYHCGSKDDTEIPPALLESYKSVHPVCAVCLSQGIEYRKRAPCKRKL